MNRTPSTRPGPTAAPNRIRRFLGGSPLSVIVRLVLLSIVIGFILKVIGLDPLDLLSSVEDMIHSIWDMGWGAVLSLWRYFLLGAAVVIPIWLILRLVRAR